MSEIKEILERAVGSGQITVAELASRLNRTRQHVYNLLSGDYGPTLKEAENLGEILGFSIEVKKRKKMSA